MKAKGLSINAFHLCKLCLPEHLESTACHTLNQVKIFLYFYCFLILCPCFLALAESGWRPELGEPISYEIGPFEEDEDAYTWDAVWDASGIAYLARNHLWRWDGESLKRLAPNELEGLRVLEAAPDGRIWVGGVNLFGVYDPRTDRYESYVDKLPAEHRNFGEAWEIFVHGDTVWLGAFNTLFCVSEEATKVYEFESKDRVLFFSVEGDIFAHQRFVGLWQIFQTSKQIINDDYLISNEVVIGLKALGSGKLIAVSRSGVILLDRISKKVLFQGGVELLDKSISCVEIFGDYVYVGTLYEGLFVVDLNGNVIDRITEFQGKSIGSFLNLKKSPNDEILICGTDSLRTLMPAESMGLFYHGRNIIIQHLIHTDSMYFCNSASGVWRFYQGVSSKLQSEEITNRETKKLSEWGGWLYYDQYERIERFRGGELEEVLFVSGEILTFEVMWEGSIVVGYYDGVEFYKRAGAGFDSGQEVLQGERFEQLEEDGQGRLWGVSDLGELWRFRLLGESMRAERVTAVCGRDLSVGGYEVKVFDGGVVVVFEDGLAYLSDEEEWEWRSFTQVRRLPDLMEWGVEGNELVGWLLNRVEGYWRLERLSGRLGEEMEGRLYPIPHLEKLGNLHALLVGEGESPSFTFGGTRGLFFADGQIASQTPGPISPIIYGADGTRPSEEPVFSYGESSIAFRFSVPGANLGIPIEYETRLAGKEEWLVPYLEPFREFGQLWEGRYTFEVRARDPFGRVSEASRVTFRVQAPWYRSLNAYAGYLILLVFGMYRFVRWRERSSRERERALQDLVKVRTRELERANEFKDDFIGNLSHEIRNPLNGVIGFIQELRTGEPPPEHSLRALRGAAQYLRTTVEEVLDFAKLESGELAIDYSVFELRELLLGVVEIYRNQAEQKGLTLTTDIQVEAGVGVYTDAKKLQQIVGNLAGNAIKFTGLGHVHVGILIRGLEDGSGLLRIWVEDSGCGISEDNRERIFQKFYQVREGHSKTTGTGLGLTLVQRYVDLLGGALEVESTVGEGSTFFVSLPVELRLLEPVSEEDSVNLNLQGIRVLVIEDMEYNRILLNEQLKGLGCEVDLAEDGARGYEMALQGQYRAVFVDWDLPGMNGLEVTEALRGDHRFERSTQIIGMTAAATVELQEACMAAGMNAFLGKPLSIDRIRKILSTLVEVEPLIHGKGLLAELPSEDGWGAVLRRWRDYHATYLGELREAMEAGDCELIRKAAHRVLGHLRMLEVHELPALVTTLMEAAQAEEVEVVKQSWEALQGLLARFDRDLDACEEWT